MKSEWVGAESFSVLSFQVYSDEGHLSYVLNCVCNWDVGNGVFGTGGVKQHSYEQVIWYKLDRKGQENQVTKKESERWRKMKENKSQGREK